MNKIKIKEETDWDNPIVNLWYFKIKKWNKSSLIQEYIHHGGVMIFLNHQLECALLKICKKNKFKLRKIFNKCKFLIFELNVYLRNEMK